jgi:hypothetical protein
MHCGGATSMRYRRVESGLATGIESRTESRRFTGMGQRGRLVARGDGRDAGMSALRLSDVKGSKRNVTLAGRSRRFAVGELRDSASDALSGIRRGACSVGLHAVVG